MIGGAGGVTGDLFRSDIDLVDCAGPGSRRISTKSNKKERASNRAHKPDDNDDDGYPDNNNNNNNNNDGDNNNLESLTNKK